ncbi:hypothetical protein OV208_05775 [Corallococcus sp. bb12-1]|uniref:hypothetical protein n=1 Tax=Corallococcus sp. bb12-1 TaxID=2996784 RepID=UPI00226E61DF|nr:hypothetical protein [Corallococcus sp. bb12-1]MCY1040826.1 hypothetical protein [Corallococcus sp. bb12-1]
MFMSSVVMVALVAAPASAPAESRMWKVTGTDVTFVQSPRDLRGLRGNKEVFGLQSRKAAFLADFEAEPGTDVSDWDGSQSINILSVVGPWVSYEQSGSGYTGGAHPYAYTNYVTQDVTKGKDGFSLLDVFAEKDVLQALKADGFVRKHVDDEEAFKNATTVESLLEGLGPGEDCVGFEYGLDSVKRSVAFHHVEGDKVAVRIAFGYAGEMCRGNKFVVGVLLPIPKALRPALDRAAKREEGFLMKDAKAVKAPSAQFTWEPPKPKTP